MSSKERIIIQSLTVDAIREQALREMPNEACGYLSGRHAGDGSLISMARIPLTNIDASPEHFSLDPKEQFAAVKQAREKGQNLIAVYHSHPETPARMSDEDIRLANDPNTVYIIYSVSENQIKGFKVSRDKDVIPFPVEINHDEP